MADALTHRARLQSALDELGAVLSEIVATAEQKNKERCPYRNAQNLCTFTAGCQNQRRDHAHIHCAGDHLLHWTTDSHDQS